MLSQQPDPVAVHDARVPQRPFPVAAYTAVMCTDLHSWDMAGEKTPEFSIPYQLSSLFLALQVRATVDTRRLTTSQGTTSAASTKPLTHSFGWTGADGTLLSRSLCGSGFCSLRAARCAGAVPRAF